MGRFIHPPALAATAGHNPAFLPKDLQGRPLVVRAQQIA
jgi:hypothetical protein